MNQPAVLDAAIPKDVQAEIMRRLRLAEQEHDVKILLAIESGSRAWGFASPNSDYDVRFIYVHKKDWYLSVNLEDKRDVIEYAITDDIDLNGWDLRKALKLFWKSNPAFVEWLQSPIVYLTSGGFKKSILALMPDIYSCRNGLYHYANMAKADHRLYLTGDSVSLKKYFYSLRALLSVRWIERYQSAPPIEFEKLLHLLDDHNLLRDIDALLVQKKAAPELGKSAPIASISAFIESELSRIENVAIERVERERDFDVLNAVFRSELFD